MNNPASEYCVSQGGKLEIVNGPGGQRGFCTLPNGNRVEEWELFRNKEKYKMTTKNKFLAPLIMGALGLLGLMGFGLMASKKKK